ncbi:MAG TPA: alpha/beta hydrolase, partial [Pyrinomonadaceae bacterium]|nr:alpha/beta hydrolase [Pyrinomonadaceae bacterium]
MLRSFILIAALLLTVPASAQQLPAPPPQPETGPGGKKKPHAAVIKSRYGQGANEYWIYEPDRPKPKTAPVVIFLHGWSGTNPLYYGAWIDHVVKRGNIVVFPRYQSSILTSREDFIPNTLDAVKAAFARLQSEPGHVLPDLNKVAAVGHSLGGVLAASVAALAGENGLPQVRAVMAVEPGLTRAPVSVPMADLGKIPGTTLLLSIAGDRDTLAADHDAKRIYYESKQISADNKDFVLLVSDERGRPGLIGGHRAPTAPDNEYDNGEGDLTARGRGAGLPPSDARVDSRTPTLDALDYYGLWKLFDGLC